MPATVPDDRTSGPAVLHAGRCLDRRPALTYDTDYALDLIGLGESHSPADEDHSSQGQARAIRGALDALGVGSYTLVGNDTGGWVARELALIDRERVSHLVLTNTEIPEHRPPWIPIYC